jgi:beta-galactosidase/beta-glucuronidase
VKGRDRETLKRLGLKIIFVRLVFPISLSLFYVFADHWWMAGIHRSVELIRKPLAAAIADYQVQADATGHITCHVECRKRCVSNSRITLHLYDDVQLTADGDQVQYGSCIWTASKDVIAENACAPAEMGQCVGINLSGDIRPGSLKLWSAEMPNLYTLTVSMESLDGSVVHQVESCRVGFRTVDIRDGCVHVNGKRITVCGINRHGHDPDHGKVVSLERMKQDICLLK